MDKVFIQQLALDTVIGVYDWEREVRQRLLLDLEMATDNRVPARSGELADALDYHAVASRLQDFAAEQQPLLLETLAEQCAEIVQTEFSVAWLRLRLSKPGAVAGAEAVGVEIERGQLG